MPKFRFPQGSLVYFQFVFAAITPILFIGSVVGRIKFKVWLIFVPLWITFAYAVNAFLLWGGGFWAGKGALDFSGGYVIHLAAGVSGFVAAAMVGPRLARDRQKAVPNNLLFIAVGAGILWLGWNGFNGGDPYFAGADATAAVVNTNLATAVAMMTWVIMDMGFGKNKKPTFLGAVNGMICGLVGITPAAGYVNGVGAIVIGVVTSAVVWVLFGYLPRKVWPFNKVDDALGVVYTHGFAGLIGGLLVGLLADPKMIVYLGLGKNPDVTTSGLFYGHPKQLLIQAGAALTVIIWDALVTFVILRVIKFFTPLRMTDAELHGRRHRGARRGCLPGGGARRWRRRWSGDGTPDGAARLPHTQMVERLSAAAEQSGRRPARRPPGGRGASRFRGCPALRYLSGRATSVAAEGLLEPPGAAVRGDLGVDHDGPRRLGLPASREPARDRPVRAPSPPSQP